MRMKSRHKTVKQLSWSRDRDQLKRSTSFEDRETKHIIDEYKVILLTFVFAQYATLF